MIQEPTKEELILFLIHNQHTLKNSLSSVTNYKNKLLQSNKVFNEEIEQQYYDYAKDFLAIELAKTFACSTETIMIVLQEMDIKSFLSI